MTETGHVLFLDLVGYSRWSLEQQAERVDALLTAVRATAAFQCADGAGELIRIGTGDGVALVFLRFPEAPLQCACELQATTTLPLRMGIHLGPVTPGKDINGTLSVTGSGINLAKQVMDFAGEGEVFLSESAAAPLREHEHWRARLHYLGERRGKHGDLLRLWSLDALPRSPPITTGSAGGGVPPGAGRYVVREVDRLMAEALTRQEAIVRVKGPRQVGKTSLLARGLQQARTGGARVAIVDFQALGSASLATPEALYRTLAESLAEQLELTELPEAHWSASRAAAANLERFLRRAVFSPPSPPLVWGWDEVDRLFALPYGSEVFGLLRSWHNRRSLDPGGPWDRLTIALAYATEAHLFLQDLNQSPFNVGVQLTLLDFTRAELTALARQDGIETDLSALHTWLGGQPYLCRRALDVLAAGESLTEAHFADHLERVLVSVTQDPRLLEALHRLLQGKPCDWDPFFRLRSAGVIVGEGPTTARLRCPLYTDFLRRRTAP